MDMLLVKTRLRFESSLLPFNPSGANSMQFCYSNLHSMYWLSLGMPLIIQKSSVVTGEEILLSTSGFP